jgi:hypothetical protein
VARTGGRGDRHAGFEGELADDPADGGSSPPVKRSAASTRWRNWRRRSIATRKHGGGLGIKPTNVFTNAEGCIAASSPTSDRRCPLRSRLRVRSSRLRIMLMCEIRQGKLFKVREYFDLLTLLEPGTPHKHYL